MLSNARHAKTKLISRIEHHAATANSISNVLVHNLREQYVRSYFVKVALLSEVRPTLSHSLDELTRLAERIDVLRTYEEPIPWRYKPRKSGPPRLVCDLPPPLRVAHAMVRELIVAQHQPAPHIFDWRGRGKDRLLSALAEALPLRPYVVVADIRQCFASANVEWVLGRPEIPFELSRSALDSRALNFRRYGPHVDGYVPIGDHQTEQTAPCGLLEGSLASNALCAMMFDDLPAHLAGNVSTFQFSDNIAIAATSRADCQRACDDLVRYMTGHPAGPFSLRHELFAPRTPFEFTGYMITLDDGAVSVALSGSNEVKTLRRIFDAAQHCPHEDLIEFIRPFLTGAPALTEDAVERLLEIATDEFVESANKRRAEQDVQTQQEFAFAEESPF